MLRRLGRTIRRASDPLSEGLGHVETGGETPKWLRRVNVGTNRIMVVAGQPDTLKKPDNKQANRACRRCDSPNNSRPSTNWRCI